MQWLLYLHRNALTTVFDDLSDIDECETGEHDCNVTSSTCMNTAGSYNCISSKHGVSADGSNRTGRFYFLRPLQDGGLSRLY